MFEFDKIKIAFIGRGKGQEIVEYKNAHDALLARIEKICKAEQGGIWGDLKRIKESSLVLRQVLLHRSINLFEGALSSLILENVYTMTLALRGHFETTAALGYLHKRLYSLLRGNLDPKVVDKDICVQLLGRRDRVTPELPEAKQIMTLLEYADNTISKHILGGTAKQYDMLTDCYKFLCEFCHPNFHSNFIAFDLDKGTQRFVIRHSQPMRDIEFNLIGYLLISSPIFVDLFDRVGDVFFSRSQVALGNEK